MTVISASPTGRLQCSLVSSVEGSEISDIVEVSGPGGKLKITFVRTLRVPANGKTPNPIPSMGLFPLFPVAQYQQNLPAPITNHGGLLLPMYRKHCT